MPLGGSEISHIWTVTLVMGEQGWGLSSCAVGVVALATEDLDELRSGLEEQ